MDGTTKTAADVAAELQNAVTAEGADAASHEAAINAAIADLNALPTAANVIPATGVFTFPDGTTANFSVAAA
jgi:hypothetical protein